MKIAKDILARDDVTDYKYDTAIYYIQKDAFETKRYQILTKVYKSI